MSNEGVKGNVIDTFYYSGAVLAVIPSAWLTWVFAHKWENSIFRALTVYFAGSTLVNGIVLTRDLVAGPEWYPVFRLLHATVLWYLVWALRPRQGGIF